MIKNKFYKINKGFITQKIDGKITIFDGEKSQLITFNETATFIFERIKRKVDTEKIIDLIVKKYKVKPEKIKKDFVKLISELKSLKIVS